MSTGAITTGKFTLGVDDSGVGDALRKLTDPQVTSKAFDLVARQLYQFIVNTFRDQTDPWGAPWPDWSAATKAARRAKRDFRVQKLVDSRDMLNSVHVIPDGTGILASVGEGLGVYPLVQQFGDPHVPQRAFFPMHSLDDVAFPDDWVEQVFAPIQAAYEEATK